MKKIYVFSSFAEDNIVYKNTKVLGGPAYFIKENLENLQADFQLFHGKKAGQVEIQKDKHGEDIGTIQSVSTIAFPRNGNYKQSIILISTLEKEFELSSLASIENALIVLDVQGYIRNIGTQKREIFSDESCFQADYLKATQSEYRLLDETIKTHFQTTKGKGIIITKGAHGVEYKSHCETLLFPVQDGNFRDTIGAGDTFISSFCFGLSKNLCIQKSLEFSINNTSKFLVQKNKFYTP